MKTKFIRINEISEVNTAKISVRDLNNRYIDKQGNMYGLKYNRKTRKVEILKIIRTPAKSSQYYRQMVAHQKKDGFKRETASAAILNLNNENIENSSFDPELFISKTPEFLTTYKDRLNGIMMNIKNSRVILENDKMSFSQLNDIFRNLDIEGIQRVDKVLATHKELKSYPRSINYYLAKIDTNSKKVLDTLGNDTLKMKFIIYYELYNALNSFYRTLTRIMRDLNFFLESYNPEESKDVTFAEKKFYQDAHTSVLNTIKETEKHLEDVNMLGHLLSDAKNFKY